MRKGQMFKWEGEQIGGSLGVVVFHTGEDDVMPITGEAARKLCEFVIDALRYRRDKEGQ